jgi:O-methyltransferase
MKRDMTLRDADQRYLELVRKCLVGLIYPEGQWEPIEKLSISGESLQLPPEILMLRRVPIDPRRRDEGRDWPALAYTMVGCQRLENIRWCVERVLESDIPGDFLEAGVWRGGASMYMRALLKAYGVTDRTVWLADSFEGMPVPSDLDLQLDPNRDYSRQDFLRVSQEQVEDNFRRFDLLDGQVRFLKGWFKDSLPSAPVQRLALLRLDGDHYTSTRDTLEALYHKVSPGGFVIVDDYFSWSGCRKAVDEFRQERGITAPMQQVDWTGAFWQVPAA